MPQSMESQVNTLGKLMDTIQKEFAKLEDKVAGNDRQACAMIKNLQDRATKLEDTVPNNDRQACAMIKNLQDRATKLEDRVATLEKK
jgi:chaperonin cofactor prefoldin